MRSPAPSTAAAAQAGWLAPLLVLAVPVLLASAPGLAQRLPTLPGPWPLDGSSTEAPAALPLPDRSLQRPTAPETSFFAPGVDVSAGFLFEGQDPTVHRDLDRIRPSDRSLPSEAQDQPRAVPGVSVTVPLGR